MRRCAHVLSLVLLLAGTALAGAGLQPPTAADAAVVHRMGFHATVAGWTSWYGSYGLGTIGDGWCIDHGLRAPDAVHGYVATGVPDASADARAAMAWLLGAHPTVDRIGAAAMMLVLHDLMGATYPTGRLDVDRLAPADLAGFDGLEVPVLERARAWKADALAHRHLRGPLRVDLVAPGAAIGASTPVGVTVRDANGAAVVGARVTITSPTSSPGHPPAARTDADGSVTIPFTVTRGMNRFEADVRVPSTELTAWAPTTARAQRVAQPHELALRAAGGFEAELPDGELEVHKTGDAEPGLPVTGAVFEVTDERGAHHGRLVVGDDGRTPSLPLRPGRYRVREVQAPTGYAHAPDVVVDVAAGARVVVDVEDEAIRGSLEILKVDASDGRPLAGATATVAPDVDGDGRPEEPVATVTTGADGRAVVTDLLPGRYLITELEAPTGYDLLDDPVPVEVRGHGPTVTVTLEDRPRSTVRFRKVPVGAAPDWATLAGARFAVVDLDAPDGSVEVGSCTTDERGECSLPVGALVGGRRHCWGEVEVPPGWRAAEPRCFGSGGAGATVEVEVPEPSGFVDVTATKTDAVSGAPLAGATYDLFGEVGPELARPAGGHGTAPDGLRFLGRARSDRRGRLRWPLVASGQRLCAVEAVAPEGYERAAAPTCSDAHDVDAPLHLRLTDRPIAVMGPPPTVPPTTVPTTAPPATAPQASTTTTAPPTTPPTTTVPPVTAPPTTVPVRRSVPELPVTGSRSGPLTTAGLALVVCGGALQLGARRRSP